MKHAPLHFAIYHVSGVLVARVKVTMHADVVSASDSLRRTYPKCQPYLYNPAEEPGEFVNVEVLNAIAQGVPSGERAQHT